MWVDALFIVGRERVMNKTWLCLAGLILVSSSFQIALSSSDPASYDVMADVNRDRTVDIYDLNRLGRAYGSNLDLPSEPGKVVVTVLSFDKEPPEVENTRVAAVGPELLGNQIENPINVTYTNSSGIATFDLSPSKNYTAIAWSGSAYNSANFTTNPLGEATLLILLRESSVPPIRALPDGWVTVTLLDNETGSLVFGWDISPGNDFVMGIYGMQFSQAENRFVSQRIRNLYTIGGVVLIPPSWSFNKPFSKWGLALRDDVNGWFLGSCIYSPDENGCANAILFVTIP